MLERFKKIRKDAGLTQAELSDLLNVSRAYVGQVECGAKPLSDRTIRDVCRLLNVNEEWLRTGVGDPYAPRSRNQEIADFMNSAMEGEDDDFKTALVSGLASLDQADWEDLARIIRKMLAKKEG